MGQIVDIKKPTAPSLVAPIREIRLVLFSNGQLQMTAPMEERKLCEQMLEEAGKTLAGYHATSTEEEQGGEASRIILPNGLGLIQPS
ncbi:MAG: hypothetical protein EXR86_12410 [Gammaproteobacteria bacterium]|nr:hypothetical protein [Gammaproteobacteria bacterium]